mmetsp:Transcript_51427/g.133646  ORF Transcript_51427/g.133646 Transcript_51427/m.133646 type:complete len:111 (-) Transcript_51427:47-379(-)
MTSQYPAAWKFRSGLRHVHDSRRATAHGFLLQFESCDGALAATDAQSVRDGHGRLRVLLVALFEQHGQSAQHDRERLRCVPLEVCSQTEPRTRATSYSTEFGSEMFFVPR